MRILSKISVAVPQSMFEIFLAKVSSLTASSWRRDPTVEESANQVLGPAMGRYVYFFPLEGERFDVVFHYHNERLKLATVLPPRGQTSYAAHARLIKGIWNAGLAKACIEMGLHVEYTPAREVKAEAGLPPAVSEALRMFSLGVNKGSAPVDPDDIALWCRFLVILHATGSSISEEQIVDYLAKKKFPHETIMELLRQLEMANTLLPMYDRLLQSSKAATVQ